MVTVLLEYFDFFMYTEGVGGDRRAPCSPPLDPTLKLVPKSKVFSFFVGNLDIFLDHYTVTVLG